MRNRSVRVAAVAAAAAMVLGSCTSGDEDSPDGDDRAACDTGKGTLVIGVIAPLSGALTAQGKGIENATRLAVDQANSDCAVDGYRLAVQPQDDGADPKLGAQAATLLAATPNLVGVVSTVGSPVAAAVAPVLDSAGVLQVSPANTADGLSRGPGFRDDPERQFETYFRTSTVESLQGPFAADYLAEKAEKAKLAVVADGRPAGEGLADSFVERAGEKGATVVTRQRIAPDTKDFTKLIAALRPFAPDAVYLAGGYPAAGSLSAQLAAAGLDVPVVGGDTILNAGYPATGGRDGDLAVAAGAPVEELDSARAFAKAYQAAGYQEPPGPHGAFAYDAANAIIGSLATTVGDGKWSSSMRDELVANAGRYRADGATGEISFDEYGDTGNHVLTVYELRERTWQPVETGRVTS